MGITVTRERDPIDFGDDTSGMIVAMNEEYTNRDKQMKSK